MPPRSTHPDFLRCGEPWTPDEDQAARRMAGNVELLVKALERTPGAVRKRLRALGCVPGVGT